MIIFWRPTVLKLLSGRYSVKTARTLVEEQFYQKRGKRAFAANFTMDERIRTLRVRVQVRSQRLKIHGCVLLAHNPHTALQLQ